MSSTVARTRICVPGRSGLSQRTSSMPGAPIELESSTKPSAIIRINRQQMCQPEAPRPPSRVALRRRLVEMHRLRIELGGEGDDLLARHQPRAVDGDRAGLEVFPMELRHGRFLVIPGTRARLVTHADDVRLPKIVSRGKPEMQHVAVGDHVVLAFEPQLAGIARAGLAAAGDIVVIADGFGADEAALEIGMDDAGRLRRLGALR